MLSSSDPKTVIKQPTDISIYSVPQYSYSSFLSLDFTEYVYKLLRSLFIFEINRYSAKFWFGKKVSH